MHRSLGVTSQERLYEDAQDKKGPNTKRDALERDLKINGT